VESMEYVHSTWIPYGMWGDGKVNMLRAIAGCVPICICSSSLGGGRSNEKRKGY